MKSPSKSSVLIGFNNKTSSKLALLLSEAKLDTSTANSVDEIAEQLRAKFFKVIILYSKHIDTSLTDIIIETKNISPLSEIIIITDSPPPMDLQESKYTPGTPNQAPYCYVQTPINVRHIITLVIKAIEKQELSKIVNNNEANKNSELESIRALNVEKNLKQLLRKTVQEALSVTKGRMGTIALYDNNKFIACEYWDGKVWVDTVNIPEAARNEVTKRWSNASNKSKPLFLVHEDVEDSEINTIRPLTDSKGELLGAVEILISDKHYTPAMIERLDRFLLPASTAIENLMLHDFTSSKLKQLKQNERNFKLFSEHSPHLLFLIQNNDIQFANKTASHKLQLSQDELQKKKITDITAHSHIESINKLIKDCLSEHHTLSANLIFTTKDGGELLAETETIHSTYDDKPAVLLMAKEPDPMVRQDEETLLLSSSVNSLHSAITITDMKRKIIYINKAHENTFDYEANEIIGRDSSILYPAEGPSGVSNKIYEATLMVGWEGERLAVRKNGGVFPVYEKTSVIKDNNGMQTGIVSVVDDISTRKKLEQTVKESEERYRTLIETARSAIIAFDEKARILVFNPAAEKMFGYTKEEATDNDLSMLLPQRHKNLLELPEIKESIYGNEGDATTTYEFAGLNRNGDEFPIEISFSSCKIEGRVIITAIIFDITERQNLQNQLIQSAKLAAVGELISGVTHEVNNPLAVVIGYSDMLLDDEEINEEFRDALQAINNEAERAKNVIQNVLSFARKHEPGQDIVQINDILENTLRLTNYELRKNRITVETEYDPELPQIVGDSNRLQQVFLNLMMNALQAMVDTENQTNKLTLGTRTKIKQESDNEPASTIVQITFKDTGPGISPKNIDRIFDPFFTTKPVGKGTGLGLSVSSRIIQDHNGRIYAVNNKSRGITFFIELPIMGIEAGPIT